MDVPKILTGEELVDKGITKNDAALPELGMKKLIPNGSWVEQKQVQSSLEARKDLVGRERIEKRGIISQAVWNDELKLAEVSQQSGGYWQYMGHYIGKKMYLYPEEALYLIEVNCLQLKHNEVTISLQKAYSLLLQDEICIDKYRVFAYLSRIGYRVFRHNYVNNKPNEEPIGSKESLMVEDHSEVEQANNSDCNINKENTEKENIKSDETVIIPNSECSNVDTSETDDQKQNANESDMSNVNNETSINKENNEVENTKSDETVNISNPECVDDTTETPDQKQDGNNSDMSDVNNETSINKEDNEVENTKFDETVNIPNPECSNVDTTVTADQKQNGNNTEIIKDDSLRNDNQSNPLEMDTENKIDNSDTCDVNNETLINKENNEVENTKSDETVNISNPECINIDTTVTADQKQDANNAGISTEDSDGNGNQSNPMEVDTEIKINEADMCDDNNATSISKKRVTTDEPAQIIKRLKKVEEKLPIEASKVDRLKNIKNLPCNGKSLQIVFKIIPDMFQKDTVTISVPDDKYIPKNIYTNKLSYVLNMANIRAKTGRLKPTSPHYPINHGVNNTNVRRIRNSTMNTPENDPAPSHHFNRFPRNTGHFRPFGFWRTRCSVESYQYNQFNVFYQRPFLANCFMNPRFPTFLRQVPNPNNMSWAQNRPHGPINTGFRMGESVQRYHLERLKHLAWRLNNLVTAGNSQNNNIQSLQRLLQTYNRRYGTRLRFNAQLDVEDENILETIELEDEDESNVNRQRVRNEESSKNKILNKINELSIKLKKLASMGKASVYKRAFSNLVKQYNKRYDADIYMNNNYEIIDRKQVTLDSSSDYDSDCVIEEPPIESKLYRNPYNVLREREIRGDETNDSDKTTETIITQYDELKKVFENWLPDADDFGRAEVAQNNHMRDRLMEYHRYKYLYHFLQEDRRKYTNWLEAKITYIEEMNWMQSNDNDNSVSMDNETPNNTDIRPIITPEDYTDMPSMLNKLRIIKKHNYVDEGTTLTITFDVYNRNVQNFKKTNPPKPNFRVICIKVSSSFPSGDDISALHNKYDDNGTIVFAIIGSSSISFLQINNFELPLNVPSTDGL